MLIVGIGSMVATALAVADKLTAEACGCGSSTRSGRCRCPQRSLAWLARHDGSPSSGTARSPEGSAPQVAYAVRQAGLDVPVDIFGLPREFLDHGSRGQVLEASGLTADAIVTSLRSRLA